MADLSEKHTRQNLIDAQLVRAGWTGVRRRPLEEVAIRANVAAENGAGYTTSTQFADYVLLGDRGKPLAVVEAKRTSRDPVAGKRQAEDYADALERQEGACPFIFLTNGKEIHFIDRGRFPATDLSSFLSPDDLARRQRQRDYAQDLAGLAPRGSIIDRDYQIEAVRTVAERVMAGHRQFLFVMATGTGKTRTAIALMDLLMRGQWIQRVLFLVDRRELARQAMNDLKTYLPGVSRSRIEGGEVNADARIHVATYPSMMQVYSGLSVGHFDLIIADESHRSIYNRYGALFSYFHALQLGLTATPTDYIDHNTYQLFGCSDGLPTFHYSLEEAIDDEHLVPYRIYNAQTRFQLKGIRGKALAESDREQIRQQGYDPDDMDFEGTDLERKVTNVGTNDALVSEFMEKARPDAAGTTPAKTIIFAVSQAHAKEIWSSFNRLRPELQRHGFAEIIHSGIERADELIEDFKLKDMPRVAISVDMLDTGIDVPPVENLVFAKPVFSTVKFWQMVGRGTRLWTNRDTGKAKKDFLILDYWENFERFGIEDDENGATESSSIPLPVRLFRQRIEKLRLLATVGDKHAKSAEEIATTCQRLTAMVRGVPQDNVNVRPHLDLVMRLSDSATADKHSQWLDPGVSIAIAGLMRFVAGQNLHVRTFENWCEQATTALLNDDADTCTRIRQLMVRAIASLPTKLDEVAAQDELLTWLQQDEFWAHLDLMRLRALHDDIAPLMRYRVPRETKLVRLDLADQIARREWVIYGPAGEGAFAETYRQRVEEHIRGLVDRLPALRKLRNGRALTRDELLSLETELNTADLFITEGVLQQVYHNETADLGTFLSRILGGEPVGNRSHAVREAFDAFIAEHKTFTATQLNFVRTVRDAILQGIRVNRSTLEQPPFCHVGNASALFSSTDLTALMKLSEELSKEAA